MCCLLNFTANRFARICSHSSNSASVANCLFLWANSFRRTYLSGDAVLYNPSFFAIVKCCASPPLGEGWEGVISLLYEFHNKLSAVCSKP